MCDRAAARRRGCVEVELWGGERRQNALVRLVYVYLSVFTAPQCKGKTRVVAGIIRVRFPLLPLVRCTRSYPSDVYTLRRTGGRSSRASLPTGNLLSQVMGGVYATPAATVVVTGKPIHYYCHDTLSSLPQSYRRVRRCRSPFRVLSVFSRPVASFSVVRVWNFPVFELQHRNDRRHARTLFEPSLLTTPCPPFRLSGTTTNHGKTSSTIFTTFNLSCTQMLLPICVGTNFVSLVTPRWDSTFYVTLIYCVWCIHCRFVLYANIM